MRISDVVSALNSFAPLPFQESYDNSGLLVGEPHKEAISALLTLDVTEAIVDEAIEKSTNLIIAHHPVIFSGLKSITGKSFIERSILKAIRNDVAIYAGHTNFDNAPGGVSAKLAEKIDLKKTSVLQPLNGFLSKLVVFIPFAYVDKVRDAIFEAGAGSIGEYDECSFNIAGEGTFRASCNTEPFTGNIGQRHTEKEVRCETIFPNHLQQKIVQTMIKAHPYQEVAYDIYILGNKYEKAGAGIIGEMENEIPAKDFFDYLKEALSLKMIRHTALLNKSIKTVALCGGSGSSLLTYAIRKKADIFVSADFKYHQFFDAEKKIIIADIGHYESEIFTLGLFYDFLKKNFPNFAVHLSEINSNPINYY
jgi:dinuclear metal center YbgI/SA1388 family protein